MSIPDFDILVSLRADELTGRILPDAETRSEGDAVKLERHETRTGVPPRMRSGKRYKNVTVERRVLGEQQPEREDPSSS